MSLFRGFEHIVREQEPLAPLTWFRLGGCAEYFAEPTERAQLADILTICHQAEMPVRVLGGGSRVLIQEDGVQGMVIQLSAPCFASIDINGTQIKVGGGTKLGHLVSTAVGAGLAGLESLVGIPGTVGGALRGNASSQGSAIGQCTIGATVISRKGELIVRDKSKIRFSHGESSLDEPVILDGTFAFEPGDVSELTRRMQKSWIVRRAKQPAENQGIGRIFKDAQGMTAAELLDQAGVRGMSVGNARVTDESANFVMAAAGATSQDVLDLTEKMREKVASSLGVDLSYELEIW